MIPVSKHQQVSAVVFLQVVVSDIALATACPLPDHHSSFPSVPPLELSARYMTVHLSIRSYGLCRGPSCTRSSSSLMSASHADRRVAAEEIVALASQLGRPLLPLLVHVLSFVTSIANVFGAVVVSVPEGIVRTSLALLGPAWGASWSGRSVAGTTRWYHDGGYSYTGTQGVCMTDRETDYGTDQQHAATVPSHTFSLSLDVLTLTLVFGYAASPVSVSHRAPASLKPNQYSVTELFKLP